MRQTTFKGKTFTAEEVLAAMERFDREKRDTFPSHWWRTYTIEHNGRRYPPKEVLRMVTGLGKFKGGEPTNRCFRRLGFSIVTVGEVAQDETRVADVVHTSLSPDRDVEKPYEQTQLPEVVFSPWSPWNKRASLHRANAPGVYLLAHWDSPPPGPANPEAREIIYVGETTRPLKKRWSEFHTSATTAEKAHSGGRTYHKIFAGHIENLYVAAFPVAGLGNVIGRLFCKYVERKLLLDYGLKWGIAPRVNRR